MEGRSGKEDNDTGVGVAVMYVPAISRDQKSEDRRVTGPHEEVREKEG